MDDTPPSLNAVAFWPLSCGDSMDALPAPEVLDACGGETTLSWNDNVAVLGCATPASEIVRTYTATDACGNQGTASTAAVFLDFAPPVWTTLPPDTLVDCAASMEVVLPVASDNCTAVEVTWLADTLGMPSSGVFTVLNHFLASDACGNTATHTQEVNHVDQTPPSWTFVPADTSLQCGQAIPMVMPEASDNCSADVTVAWVSDDWSPAIVAAQARGPGLFKPPTSRATTPLSCSTLPCSTPWRLCSARPLSRGPCHVWRRGQKRCLPLRTVVASCLTRPRWTPCGWTACGR